MKIISMGTFATFSLIFVIIVFPLFFHTNLRVKEQELSEEIIMRYDQGLHAAVQDAAFSLKLNEAQDHEAKYDSIKNFRANKEYAVDSFYRTLFINFGVSDNPMAQNVLKTYVPALAVIDYDGFWIYTDEKYKNSKGETEFRQLWKAKKPYSYSDDAGNSLSFTLDDYVVAFDAATQTWREGKREEVAAMVGGRISLLNNPSTFEEVRRSTIVRSIQDDLGYYINYHNEFAKRFGSTYTFTLPTISQEEWNNTIDDIGIMAFIQGLPLGINYYNNYALGGGRLVKKPSIYGAIRNGIKIYYRSNCNFPDEVVEKFTSEKAAAAKGYFPRACSSP
ncbi:hypothetical protein [Paenibacillus chitinolyticus]|uniref:hypothetical protein n=1 Tax=Paenibacillus chitinolyticus TaxID=79263 RepID=UPI001C4651E2|nr:hypothetical protein [Paenibacillus chitinolyticus]MBV6717216.1 hypothetical protein [Paenibacillus chitinolyticus]